MTAPPLPPATLGACDWASTPLGAIDRWPPALAALAGACADAAVPTALLWGPGHHVVANAAFAARVLPDAQGQGQPARVALRAHGVDDALLARVADGTRVALDGLELAPLRAIDGSVLGAIATSPPHPGKAHAHDAAGAEAAPLHALAGGVAQGLWQADAHGRMQVDGATQVPPAAGWLDAMHPDDRTRALAHWERGVAQGRDVDLEVRLWHAPAHDWRWTQVRATPLRGDDGDVRGWIGMNIDVSERRDAQERLRESETRMARALEIDTVGVVYFDLDGQVHGCNDAFARMSGYARADLGSGRLPLRTLVAGAWAHCVDRLLDELRASGSSAPSELQYARGDGTCWWGLRTGKRLDDGLAVEFVLDISERRRADADAREGAERLRLIVDGARDYAIFTLDPDGHVVDWYEGARTVFGYEAHEIAGRPDAVLFTPEDRARAANVEERAIARADGSAPDVRWHLRKDGSRVYIEGRNVALRGADGDVRGYLKIGQDVTERRRADTALRESEERFRQFGEHSSDALWIIDAGSRRLEYLNPAFEHIWGVPREALLRGEAQWADFVHPDDVERVRHALPHVLDGERLVMEYRIVRPDGEVRWVLDTGFPIRDRGGRIVRAAGIVQDFTARRLAEDALMQSELRLRTLTEGIPQLVWRSRDHALWTWSSPQWRAFTGQTQEQSVGLGWLDAVHPDDRDTALHGWRHSHDTGGLDVEYRIRRASDGAWIWHHTRSRPVMGPDGRVVEWVGTSTDVQQLKELQERQAVLVAELQHRTRNLMGVVRAVADRTMRSSQGYDQFAETYSSRLGALARVQGLLSRLDEGARIHFDELIRTELSAMGMLEEEREDGRGRVVLDGPHGIRLRSSTVQIFALALHELATNALKYGAFAQPDGHLRVRWRARRGERGPLLRMEWTESGVRMPPAQAQARGSGYGRELIERALPYQLQARTEYRHTDDGVHCVIELPVSERSAIPHAER